MVRLIAAGLGMLLFAGCVSDKVMPESSPGMVDDNVQVSEVAIAIFYDNLNEMNVSS